MSSRTYTLGQLCRRSGLARSSLLHYESLGLLHPSGRSAAGYRLYGDTQLDRLATIRRFREAGLPLRVIIDLLAKRKDDSSIADSRPVALLEARLLELSSDMDRLREQRRLLTQLLAIEEIRNASTCRNKAAWVALLRRAGFDDAAMNEWHVRFEASSPTEHVQFLRALGLPPSQIAAIRERATGIK